MISPATALAAATPGLARDTSLDGSPIRPVKFRFVVDTATSSSSRTPVRIPKQAPHPGFSMVAFASRNVAVQPSSMLSRSNACDQA